MSAKPRILTPENILYLWEAVKVQKQSPANGAKVLKYMTSELEYKPDEAADVLTKAIKDKTLITTLIPSSNNNSTIRAGRKLLEGRAFRIPELNEIEDETTSHDWYCYECHIPGELQNCTNCLRSFHASCTRANPEIPDGNLKVKSNRRRVEPMLDDQISTEKSTSENIQVLRLEESGPDQEISEIVAVNQEEREKDETTKKDEKLLSDQKPTLLLQETEEFSITTDISSIPSLKNENEHDSDIKPAENKADLICIGQVRPPSSRKRVESMHYKSEDVEKEDDSVSNNLCTKCRLIKIAKLRDPPNMSPDEIGYLLRFTFERIKGWINNDTFSTLPFSSSLSLPSKKEFELFSKMCFKYRMNCGIIDEKIKIKGYSSLTEFYCDVMDVQHCIGILYGTNSAEFEATKYLLSDCSYELTEIRQCRDCYRHSNEKSTPLWFCKPCVPRHELVFAQQRGYCFWPAKVIRVKDNQYDVRFFGSNHSRAIVDGNNVKPIDTDEKLLKIKKSVGYQKSMEELQNHQELLQFPPGKFTYEEERNNNPEIVAILNRIASSPIRNRHEMINRKSGTKSPKVSVSNIKKTTTTPAAMTRTSQQQTPGKSGKSTEILSIEIASSHREDHINSGKRKRKIYNYALLENSGNIEDEEDEGSTISDYISSKKAKTTSKGKNSDKRKGKSTPKRKSGANNHKKSTSTMENNDSSRDEQISGQDSAVSSTQEITKSKQNLKTRLERGGKTEKSYSEVVENLRRNMESIQDPIEMQRIALDSFQSEIDRLQKRINQLNNEHSRIVSKIKNRQWCRHCEKEAIYYCCWNTAYCSTDCQQKHWQSEHKKACRRTR